MIRPKVMFLIASLLFLAGMRAVGFYLGFAEPSYYEHLNTIDIVGFVIIFFLSPVMYSIILPSRRMQDIALLDSVMSIAKKAGVRLSSVQVWNTKDRLMSAMAVGVFPKLKTVIVTDKLVANLTRKEFLAVALHEIGHHRFWHIPFLLLATFSVFRCTYRLFEYMVPLEMWYIYLAKFSIVIFILMMISRQFERQADVFASSFLSSEEDSRTITSEAAGSMSSALSTIAQTHNIPPSRNDLFHGSVASRQAYLNSTIGTQIATIPINRVVLLIKIFIIALVVLGIVL